MTSCALRGLELRFLFGLNLACALAACGGDSGGAGGRPDAALAPDDNDDTDVDAGSEAGTGPEDAAVDAEETLPPLPMPDWDAALEQAGPPAGSAYAETKGTFVLSQPEALAKAFDVLAADTQDVRMFANDIQSENGGLGVDYGAVFLEKTEAQYQYPSSVGHFRIAPSTEAVNTFVSEPFDYRLKAWVPSPTDSQVGYLIELSSRQAVWVATFNADFSAITKGTLRQPCCAAKPNRRPSKSIPSAVSASARTSRPAPRDSLCSPTFSIATTRSRTWTPTATAPRMRTDS